MFGWGKKNDGFDWHKYVRTTILQRRSNRREKLDNARQAAVGGAKAAGKIAAESAQKSVAATWGGLGLLASAIGNGAARLLGPVGTHVAAGGRTLMKQLSRSAISNPLALLGAVALASGTYRWSTMQFDREALVPLVIGSLMLLAALPGLLGSAGIKLPSFAFLSRIDRRIGYAALALIAVAGGSLAASQFLAGKGGALGSLANISILPASAKPIEGKGAYAVTGDTLRLDGKLIKLSGIDTPDRGQTCGGSGKKRTRCADLAQAALEKAVKNKAVKCQPSGSPDAAGRLNAVCTVESRDVGAELVKSGFAFSTSSYFGGYAADENEASRTKAGLWANGDIERPADFRAKIWETAKKASPDGCPIKGVLTSSGNKIYHVPWAGEYGKANVRASKGERWFCSEAEAQTAGWKASEKG